MKEVRRSLCFLLTVFVLAFGQCADASTQKFLDAGFLTLQAPVTISPRSMNIQVNGKVTFTATGGTAPYRYSVSNGGGTIVASSGVYTAPAAQGNAVVEVSDSRGDRDFSILTIVKDSVTVLYENFQTGSFDTTKWLIGGSPTVIGNTLRMNNNDHMRYQAVLGAGEAVNIEMDIDNINGANGLTFCTPNIIIKNPSTPAVFGYNAATEALYALIDETMTFRIPSTQNNFSTFAELRNGRTSVKIEWNSNQLRMSKSAYEQLGSPLGSVRTVYWPGPVYPGASANFNAGFKLELSCNFACINGSRIYSIYIYKP